MDNITEKIRQIVSNLLAGKEIELVEMAYKRCGPNMVLRLLVDKKGGITIDECGWVNSALGEALDSENVITERYLLEVCSPGLDRHLKTKKDFDKEIDKLIKVITYGPIDDKREHVGRVVSCSDSCVTIESEGSRKTEIPLDKIAKACLEIEF